MKLLVSSTMPFKPNFMIRYDLVIIEVAPDTLITTRRYKNDGYGQKYNTNKFSTRPMNPLTI